MSKKQKLISEIKELLDRRPKLYKVWLQDEENPDLFHEPNGPLLTRDECSRVPARGQIFVVRASLLY